MFSDPITVNVLTDTHSIPRVDAGSRAGTFVKKNDSSVTTLNIRNTAYVNKALKKNMQRHNVEFSIRTIVPATATVPARFVDTKAYVVVEHDDQASLAEVQAVAQFISSFLSETENAGFIQRLMNNEG